MTGSASMPARRVAATILVGALALAAGAVAMPAFTSAPATAPHVVAPATPRPGKSAPRPAPSAPVAARLPASPPPPPVPPVITHVIDTGGPIRYGSYFWDDTPAPAGPLTITVDLKASVLSVFRGGYEIGTAAVIYGADDRETPLGTFPILQKDRHHVSNRYHAPMPYMLRLTGDGVSIHASAIAADYATHGCIGVPPGFARKLFTVAKLGDRVIVTKRGLVAAIENARPAAG